MRLLAQTYHHGRRCTVLRCCRHPALVWRHAHSVCARAGVLVAAGFDSGGPTVGRMRAIRGVFGKIGLLCRRHGVCHTFGVAVPHLESGLAGHTNARPSSAYLFCNLRYCPVLGVSFAIG